MGSKWYIYIIVSVFMLANIFLKTSSNLAGERKTDALRSSTTPNAKARKERPKQELINHCNDPKPSKAKANKCDLKIDKPFTVNCKLPFTPGPAREIDNHCPNSGCTNSRADQLQNKIKNNLCVSGAPVQISFDSIDMLQTAVDGMGISYGPKKKIGGQLLGGPPSPKVRSKIGRGKIETVDSNGHSLKLGEGDLVSLDAFVLDAHHADTFPFGFQGETVNCKNSLLEWNDIHIALGQTASMEECDSVTAEIIPHFRPEVWERFDSNSCTSPHVKNPLPVEGIRVKITGQLFFDGSHRPAPCGKKGSPRRRSVWEIHPVYEIEVFDDSSSSFIPFEKWAAKH